MGAISGADFRAILRFLDAGAAGSRADPLPRPTLSALEQLIPADLVEYFELRRADRAELAYSQHVDLEAAPGSAEAIATFGHENPLRWRNFAPSDGPLRLSSVISRRELRRLNFYDTFLRPNRIRDTLKIWLFSSPYSAACVSLNRSDADFSDRDADVLGVLQGHLAEMRARAIAGQATTAPGDVAVTPREAEIMTWVACGMQNDQIAARLFISPATVRKHLEHVYHKLGVASRTEALARLARPGRLH